MDAELEINVTVNIISPRWSSALFKMWREAAAAEDQTVAWPVFAATLRWQDHPAWSQWFRPPTSSRRTRHQAQIISDGLFERDKKFTVTCVQ